MRELPTPSTRMEVRWLRLAALFAVLGLLGTLAPLLWAALKAGVALSLWIALTLLAGATVQALPYAAQRLETRLLKARLKHARDNPLEQLQLQLLQRTAQVQRYRSALRSIHAQIEGMQDMLDERRQADPAYDVAKQQKALGKMAAFYAEHRKKLQTAELALSDYERHIASKRFEWSFAQAGHRVLDSLQARDPESAVRELLGAEATRAVQLEFNRVFAELDGELQALPAALDVRCAAERDFP